MAVSSSSSSSQRQNSNFHAQQIETTGTREGKGRARFNSPQQESGLVNKGRGPLTYSFESREKGGQKVCTHPDLYRGELNEAFPKKKQNTDRQKQSRPSAPNPNPKMKVLSRASPHRFPTSMLKTLISNPQIPWGSKMKAKQYFNILNSEYSSWLSQRGSPVDTGDWACFIQMLSLIQIDGCEAPVVVLNLKKTGRKDDG